MWLNKRFDGLTTSDFNKVGQVFFFCTSRLKPPAGFEDHWYVYDCADDESFHIAPEQHNRMHAAGAILLITDFQISQQVERLCRVSEFLNELDDSPAILFMPHTRSETANHIFPNQDVHEQVMNSGVDDIIHGEPAGMALPINYLGRMKKSHMLSQKITCAINQRREFNARVHLVQDSINSIVWNYLRARLRIDIPAFDSDQPRGIPTMVNGYEVGAKLGSGSMGKVFTLLHPAREEPGDAEEPGNAQTVTESERKTGQVLKVVDKAKISNLPGLKSIQHQLQVMSRVSQDSPHPNIVKFLEAYNTPSHIMFRLEDGGDLNLFQRLSKRQKEPEAQAISLSKATSMISQAIQAVWHLHTVCLIAHRDIKPENACISENGEEIKLKLTDFDVALLVRDGQRCTTICGTFPFTAPEIHLQDSYLPYPTDIWSLGILITEMLCGLHILHKVVGFSRHFADYRQACALEGNNPSEAQTARFLMTKVAEEFADEESAGRLLETHARPELCTLVEPLGILLNRMIVTDATNRLSSSEVLHLFQNDVGALPVP